MGYGGKQAIRSGDIRRFNFTGNGSNTAFDLGFTPATQNQLIVTVNGLVQHYDAFSVTGSTLTFTGTPASGDTIQVTAVVDAVGVAAIPDGAIANVSSLTVSGAATLSNTVAVTGAATFANTVAVTGNATFSNTVAITGSLTTTSNVHTIGTTLYSVANGNIGIDNSSPDRQLVVGGTRSASASNWSQFRANVGGSPPSSSNPYGLFIGCNYSNGSSEANFAYNGFLTFASWDGTTYTERMRIDSSGRVTTPYQPAIFIALGTAQSVQTGGPYKINLDDAVLNRGSHWNTSTKRFTAPVSGVYYINLSAYIYGSGSADTNVFIFINGNQTIRGFSYNPGNQSDANPGGAQLNATYYLNAGDYLEPYYNGGSTSLSIWNGGPYSTHLCVYLLG